MQDIRAINSDFRAFVDNPGINVLLFKPVADRERRRLRAEVSEVTSFPEGMDLLIAYRRFLARRGRWNRPECQEWTNRILAQRWMQARLRSREVDWSPDVERWHLDWILFLLRVLLSLYLQLRRPGHRLWNDIPQFTDLAHFKQFVVARGSLPPRWLLECVRTTSANNGSPQATLNLLTNWFVLIAHGQLQWLKGRQAPSRTLLPSVLAVTRVSYIGRNTLVGMAAGHGLRPDRRVRAVAAGDLQRILGIPDIPGFGPAEYDVEACYCIRTPPTYDRLQSALRGEDAPLKRQQQSWILEQMYVF
ncbi:hypothetical protein CB0940_03369 [Cercospora beticola]|uniref:Uncharacterized protein n=1 Tax=Cercospora beticola TaxID=122368 RepID=A0A2G5I342_CERBT|nr:hypothetical protein CB0940_03369 [Cercospora beticola]PIA99235.1 hypothetical protein CB0940_03369 [Cercospora beticola]WPB00545.1 hypothetical protein RHO25_005165 [Cercospora beticola]